MSVVLSPYLHRFIHHLWHHLMVAALITCCVYWASTFGLTGALDSATLHATQRLVSGHTPDAAKDARSKDDVTPPVILEVTRQHYETIYSNTSPLDRRALKSELSPILDNPNSAKLVVIDLDISPATPWQDTRDIDALLDAPTGPPVVLVVPAFQGTDELQKRQSEWMKARCEADRHGRALYFGFAYLSGEGGVILRYSEHYPSLGNVARWATARKYTQAPALLPASCAMPMHPDAICEFHKGAQDLDLLREHFKLIRERCTTSPIDFATVAPGRLERRPLETGVGDLATKPENNVVFIGGAYDGRDNHLTGAGPMDGVYVHAAIYSSKVTTLSHLAVFLFEITLGVMLGFAFSGLFSAAAKADHTYKNHLHREALSAAIVAKACSLFLLFLIFLLILLATAGMIFLSSYFLWHGSWLNPVPLVIGMLIDGLVASRSVPAVQHHVVSRFPAKVWWINNFGALASVALIGLTFAYLSFGASHGH